MIRRLIVPFDGNTCDGLGIVAYSKVERSIHSLTNHKRYFTDGYLQCFGMRITDQLDKTDVPVAPITFLCLKGPNP